VNLIIEQGNTSLKVAVYDKGRIVDSYVYDAFGVGDLSLLFGRHKLTCGIMSSVACVDEKLVLFLKEKLSYFIFFDEYTPVPVTVQYDSRKTLGRDRLAAAVGANFLAPGKDVLVIDAGTAITYEFVTASGVYLGGNISPGMTTRFRALNQYTEQLPLVNEADDLPEIGHNTIAAIQAGVVKGIVYEMDGYIDEYRKKKPSLLVFLTGGHSNYFERRLKNSIFADINLVLTGLNRILEYNVKNK